MFKRIAAYVQLLIVLLAIVPAWAAPRERPRDLITQRKDFLAAKAALEQGASKPAQALMAKLKNYPLLPYLHYDELRARLTTAKNKEVRDYLERNADGPLANRLRALWLYELARTKRWADYLQDYREQDDEDLRCMYLQARMLETKTPASAFDDVKRSWLTGKPQPAACDAAFERWRALGGMNEELVWQRIRLAFDARQVSLAQSLTRYLDADGKAWVDLWVKMHNEPAATLRSAPLQADSAHARELVRYGIKRLARFDAEIAHDLWHELRGTYAFSADELNETDREVAVQAASKQLPRALEYLNEARGNDPTLAIWRVRAAVTQQQWPAVLAAVRAMPRGEAGKDAWVYWMARAMREMGIAQSEPAYVSVAFDYFEQLAAHRGFYGFLAADRINYRYNFNPTGASFAESDVAEVEALPGMRRAYELYFLGMTVEARREWQFLAARLAGKQVAAAAVLAHRWGWHDRAILTSTQSADSDDLDVRFPIAYQDQVSAAARQYNVDPAWVYGILRQESAFMPDARSDKGATGLMQLMPDTARVTANSVRLPYAGPQDLLDETRNIQLGSAYLKQMYDQNSGHYALATASYNAGPQRVKSWLPKIETPADVWVESMPYSETREYVKKVLAFTAIFEQRLNGAATPLAGRMPNIKAPNAP